VAQSQRIFLLTGLVYLAFVVYGSLVPLDFHPHPINVAIRDFLHIRYLRLGIESRADWVANILLYIPIPYLWLSCVSRESGAALRVAFTVAIFIFCTVLSIGIEFTQLFFPPRTVSLNDIIAEIFGSSLGILLWWASGQRIVGLIDSVLAQGRRAAFAGLALYAIAYLAFSLFPYDFLISAAEIQVKLSRGYFHWFASTAACGTALRCGSKLIVEAIAVMPLGLLLSLSLRIPSRQLFVTAAVIGFCLGLAIETMQFFLASGITLGASVFTRVAGVLAGTVAGEKFRRYSLWPLLYMVRPIIPMTGVLYVLLLIAVVTIGKGPMLTLDQGLRRLNEINFMPFFYHYYTSESAAMTSLLGVAAMFFPLGVQYWIWRITHMREFIARGAFNAGVLGWTSGTVLEVCKLFFAGTRPDPTNVLIATIAAVGGFVGASICTRASLISTGVEELD
jgi:VanZ family protein